VTRVILEKDERSKSHRIEVTRTAKQRLEHMFRIVEGHALDLCMCDGCMRLREFVK